MASAPNKASLLEKKSSIMLPICVQKYKKMRNYAKKIRFFLVNSKKSSTFAPAFRKKSKPRWRNW